MKVSSLRQFALESVADYIENGFYDHLNYHLYPPTSDTIYSIISKNGRFSSKILKQILSKFSLTHIDLYEQPMEIIENQNLECLVSGELKKFIIYSSSSSWKNLKKLKLENKEQGSTGVDLIPKSFPNLETLILGQNHISPPIFSNLGQNLLSLRTLDIGVFCGINLNGIENLKNLEVCCIRNYIHLRTPVSIMPIFECKKLKVLDFSRDQREAKYKVIENYLKCKKVLPELVHFDCRGTDLNGEMLEELVKTHGKLKEIVAMDTVLDFSEYYHTGIEILHRANISSFIATFKHYLNLRRESVITILINDVQSRILRLLERELRPNWERNERERLENDMRNRNYLVELIRLICGAMEVFVENLKIFETGMICMEKICRCLRAYDLTPSQKDTLLPLPSQLITIGTHWLHEKSAKHYFNRFWTTMDLLPIRSLESPDLRKLIKFCMEFLKIGDNYVPKHILRTFPAKLISSNFLALWPRSNIWETLIAWIENNNVGGEWSIFTQHLRVDNIVQRPSIHPEIVKKLRDENIRNRIIIFWNSKEVNDDEIKKMRKLIQRNERQIDVYSLAHIMESKLQTVLHSTPFNSLLFFAMEFLTTLLILSKNLEDKIKKRTIWDEVNTELIKLCTRFQTSGLNFPHFPAVQRIKEALGLDSDGAKIWALMMIKLMLWNLRQSMDMGVYGLYEEVVKVNSGNMEIMDLRNYVVMNYWKLEQFGDAKYKYNDNLYTLF